jgi:hypothetical protein
MAYSLAILETGAIAMALTDFVGRTAGAAELPDQIVSELVTAAVRSSVVLQLGHHVPTTVRDSRIPVLSELPDATWIAPTAGGDVDTGLKGVTHAAFANKQIIAEELATIAVIPQNVIDDSQFDLWSAVHPLLARAIARRFDDAVMFGGGPPPATFPANMVQQATDATNVVTADVASPSIDQAQVVLQAAQKVAEQGYNANAVAVSPGWEFKAAAQKTPALVANPIGANEPFPMTLAGLGIRTRPLRWDKTKCDAIVADWNLVLVGLRKDITIETFNTGVISDATGKVIQNLLTEDKVACRVTFRAGWYLAAPPTDYAGTPCPVALVKQSP